MKFFKCPCCNKLHFTRVNGLTFENPYKTLSEFTIKKRLKCGKCHNNLAIFVNNKTSETKIIWEEYYKVYDDAFQKQKDLQAEKDRILNIEDDQEKQQQLEVVLKKIRKIILKFIYKVFIVDIKILNFDLARNDNYII